MKLFLAIPALTASVLALTRNTPELLLQDSCFENPEKCCFSEEQRAAYRTLDNPRCEKDENGTYPCAVKLAVHGWYSAFVNVYIARVFLEEFLGYPVEIAASYDNWDGIESEATTYNDDGTIATESWWDKMVDGRIDAAFEMWPNNAGTSTMIEKYTIKSQVAEKIGTLGTVGQVGWYIPSYVSEDDVFYQFFAKYDQQEAADLFADPQDKRPCCLSDPYSSTQDVLGKPCMMGEDNSGTPVSKGGLANSTECDRIVSEGGDYMMPTYGGRLMMGGPDWGYDADMMRNFGWNFTVQAAIDETTIAAVLDDAYKARQPLLFYFWEPHAFFATYNLTKVMLPPYYNGCHEKAATGGVDCDFPTDIVTKVASTAWTKEYPDAALLLRNFKLTNEDQEDMLVDSWYNGATWSDIGCNWVTTYQDRQGRPTSARWSAWLENVNDTYSGNYWADSEPTEVYRACECDTSNMRAVYRFQSNSTDAQTQEAMGERICALNGDYRVTINQRWVHESLAPERMRDIPCSYVVEGSTTSVILACFASINIISSAACLLVLFVKRDHPLVKASNRTLMMEFTFSPMFIGLSILCMALPHTATTCTAQVFALYFGICLFLSTLLAKEYAIYKLFLNRKMRIFDNAVVVRRHFAGMVCVVILLATWAAVSPFMVVVSPVPGHVEYGGMVTQTTCATADETFGLILSTICGAMVLLGCYLSFQTRNVTGKFSEAKWVMLTNYNVLVVGTMLILVTQASAQQSRAVSWTITAGALTWVGLASLGMIVGSRIYAIVREIHTSTVTFQKSARIGNVTSGATGSGFSSMTISPQTVGGGP